MCFLSTPCVSRWERGIAFDLQQNKPAHSLGVEVGMTRLQAESFPEVISLPRIPEHESFAHTTLHTITCMFSPRIEFVETHPGTYALDIQGMNTLYGDAAQLANKLR